ncbi:hypothetical protein R4Y45_07405 [Holzapfeliella sp. He02]|uniref:SecY-independent transporter protein n=1 Tax=Holzapfeliella saturejae TaxID=3082953 RepID=A0ABU8SI29_9LACO
MIRKQKTHKSFFEKFKAKFGANSRYQFKALSILILTIMLMTLTIKTDILFYEFTKFIYAIFLIIVLIKMINLINNKNYLLAYIYLYPALVLILFEMYFWSTPFSDNADQYMVYTLYGTLINILVLLVSIFFQDTMPSEFQSVHLDFKNQIKRIWFKLIYSAIIALIIAIMLIPTTDNFTVFSFFTTIILFLLDPKNLFLLLSPNKNRNTTISANIEAQFFLLKLFYLSIIVSQAISLFIFNSDSPVLNVHKELILDNQTHKIAMFSLVFISWWIILFPVLISITRNKSLMNSWIEKKTFYHKHSGRPRGLKRPYKRKEYKEYKKHKN